MSEILEEVEGLYKIIKLKEFRKTKGVNFDILPHNLMPNIDSIDRVLHHGGAVSPGKVDNVERPWYMHPWQDDNLMVLFGIRHVDIYTPSHGKIESFECSANKIYKNGKLLYTGGAMLVWPRGVFHRIVSSDEGSASINLAVHYEGFDIKTNFNIYDVDIKTGKFKVIREGHLDQMF